MFDLISDLHLLSFTKDTLPGIQPTADVLALLGDVCEANQFFKVSKFFEFVSKNWKHVLYVPGNHEFYNGWLDSTVSSIRKLLYNFKNIVIMDNDSIKIDGIHYIGSILWSDMNKRNPMEMMACRELINDYKLIKKSKKHNKAITPSDTIDLFDVNVDFITKMIELSDCDSNVILTHHAPSYKSVSPQFVGSAATGAFVSSLEHIILDRPKVKVWAHGHTHAPVDYMIDKCRVIANPLGYRFEIYKNDTLYKPIQVKVQ